MHIRSNHRAVRAWRWSLLVAWAAAGCAAEVGEEAEVGVEVSRADLTQDSEEDQAADRVGYVATAHPPRIAVTPSTLRQADLDDVTAFWFPRQHWAGRINVKLFQESTLGCAAINDVRDPSGGNGPMGQEPWVTQAMIVNRIGMGTTQPLRHWVPRCGTNDGESFAAVGAGGLGTYLASGAQRLHSAPLLMNRQLYWGPNPDQSGMSFSIVPNTDVRPFTGPRANVRLAWRQGVRELRQHRHVKSNLKVLFRNVSSNAEISYSVLALHWDSDRTPAHVAMVYLDIPAQNGKPTVNTHLANSGGVTWLQAIDGKPARGAAIISRGPATKTAHAPFAPTTFTGIISWNMFENALRAATDEMGGDGGLDRSVANRFGGHWNLPDKWRIVSVTLHTETTTTDRNATKRHYYGGHVEWAIVEGL